MVPLLDAIIGLLDVGDHPTELVEDSKGLYA
jgi:hypothetical protein